jgi:hypothetical protein
MLLNFNSQIFENGTITAFAVSVVSGVMEEHTLAFIFRQCLFPPLKVIVERFCCVGLICVLAVTRGSAGSVCQWGACNLTLIALGVESLQCSELVGLMLFDVIDPNRLMSLAHN